MWIVSPRSTAAPEIDVSSTATARLPTRSGSIGMGPATALTDQLVALADHDQCAGPVAQAVGVVGDGVEHRLQVETSGADGVEHLGHCGLAFEGGVEVVEQLGVGNRDRRLVGERLEDRCLLLVERVGPLAAPRRWMVPIQSSSWNRGRS